MKKNTNLFIYRQDRRVPVESERVLKQDDTDDANIPWARNL